jgi:mannan endo-1,6-alpha-mannosidase
MTVMEIFKADLVHIAEAPVTGKTGGNSKGNSGTGDETGGDNAADKRYPHSGDFNRWHGWCGYCCCTGCVAALAVLMPVGAAAFIFVVS